MDGSVLDSSSIGNGSTGNLAIIIRDSEAANNAGDGIVVDGRGGVAMGVVSSDNGKRGIVAQNASVTGSASTLNNGVGLFAICPGAIFNNTIVANGSAVETEDDPPCVLENNGIRP